MAHQREAALGIIEGLRSDSRPGSHGGVEALEPISIARDSRPGIAEDDGQNLLLQFDGEFKCAAMEALEETVVGASSLGEEVDESRGTARGDACSTPGKYF